MNCAKCATLRRAFEAARARYIEALASPFFKVSKAVAAKAQVDMVRAKLDFESHEEACSMPDLVESRLGSARPRTNASIKGVQQITGL